MSTSTSIVSLAANLVVFLAAASLLLVLVLRSDLLGVSPLFRAILAGAASILAVTALVHGGLSQQGAWLSTLRLASVVFFAFGCLGVIARWPRTALLGSLALLVVAEIASAATSTRSATSSASSAAAASACRCGWPPAGRWPPGSPPPRRSCWSSWCWSSPASCRRC